jgi:2-oxoglutarate dehydrogenase E1 component
MLKTADRLCRDYVFSEFLKNTFSTAKRFGSEGCDSFIAGLGALVDKAANEKVEHIVFGMPHRGRLNTLFCVLKKPAS